MGSNSFSIFLIIMLVLLSAFFSSTETAFSSVSRIRLKNLMNCGNKKAKKALEIVENYDSALSAVLIGNNIVNIAAASVGTLFFTRIFPIYGALISTIALTIIILIFGEVIPKSLAKENPEKFALSVSGAVVFLLIIFKPIIWALIKIKSFIATKFVASNTNPSVTEQELKFIIEEIEDEGVLNEYESELMQSALDFDDITVSEVLTPRVDVVAVDITDDIEHIKDVFYTEGYSRIPVYDKSIDNIIGILNEKDFIKKYFKVKDFNIRSLLKQTIYAPPKKRIAELLKEMQQQKIHLSVVTDQYGGTQGIITIEDIIEELVGEIWDEQDEVTNDITATSANNYIVSADINVYDLFEHFDINEQLYTGQSQTLGGWALELFGKIPQKGDFFEFDIMHIVVDDVTEQRINTFKLSTNPKC